MSVYDRKAQIKALQSLPAPRLQLRWTPMKPESGYQWACYYELVVPLRDGDIRRGGSRSSNPTTLVVPMRRKCLRGSRNEPMIGPGGELYADTPYRDGRHAEWDAAELGGIPIYVVALDGRALLVENTQKCAELDRTP